MRLSSRSGPRDTIVAVSSPPGRSWRGLIRVAGPGAVAACGSAVVFDAPLPARTPVRARLREPGLPGLPAWLSFFADPHSYTGDDVVELQLPGHPSLLERVLEVVLEGGARLAEPGEFTFRAFTAGKLDLTRAEGVAATIAATSDGQLRAATMLRHGRLGDVATSLVDRLATLLSLVEAGIDFTDQEDVVPIGPGELDRGLDGVERELNRLLSRSRSWGALEALPRVVLAGPPSAGKSTLFNALLGRTRAVVSALPGTTRDVLAEPLTLTRDDGGRVELMLVDIAGLDPPLAELDRSAQAAARDAIATADLVVSVVDATRCGGEAATEPRRPVGGLVVATKLDVAGVGANPGAIPGVPGAGVDIAVSAATGTGLAELRQALAKRLGDRAPSLSAEAMALQPRHLASLTAAAEALREARALLGPQRGDRAIGGAELVAGGMRMALDALAGLGGQMTPDDVIGRVFSTFCVGK